MLRVRFVSVVNAGLGKVRRGQTQAVSVGADMDPDDLVKTLRLVSVRINRLEAAMSPEGTEFEVNVSSSGALVELRHNYSGPVRWWVTQWLGTSGVAAPSSGHSLVEDSTSTQDILILRSYVVGRAVVRVEPTGSYVEHGNVVAPSGGGGGGSSPPTGTGFYHVTGGVMDAAAVSLTWTGDATGSGSGTSFALTVAKVNGATVPAAGALTTGNVLKVTGASALGYGAVNLAGGANHVTGLLPVANIAAPTGTGFPHITSGAWDAASTGLTFTGDATGTGTTASIALTVAKANGATIPAAGSLTTGNVLKVSGTSALTYGAVNLAGGANHVTGTLPVANGGTGSALSLSSQGYRYTDVGNIAAPTGPAGSFTTGIRFFVTRSCNCTGVRVWVIVPSSKSHKVSLWNAAGTRVTSATSVTATSGVYEILFSTPQALTAGTMYRVSAWETLGGTYSKITLASVTAQLPTAPFWAGGLLVLMERNWFVAGDAYPNGAAGAEVYPIDPILDA